MGCPLDAKQSALITYLPDAIAAGADLYADCRVEADRDRSGAGRARSSPRCWIASAIARRGALVVSRPAAASCWRAARSTRPRCSCARASATAAGRRQADVPAPDGAADRRSTPSRSRVSTARPSRSRVHHFADRGERIGYFLETAPIHPMLGSARLSGLRRQPPPRSPSASPFAQATIALLIDGHHDDEGGVVCCRATAGSSSPIRWATRTAEAALDALANMARLQLAAGAARRHDAARGPRSSSAARPTSPASPTPRSSANRHTLFSAHQMGGCAMGDDPRRSVVDARGRHHEVENLWIADGSVFPTQPGRQPAALHLRPGPAVRDRHRSKPLAGFAPAARRRSWR